MAATVKAFVRPQLLEWARTSARLTLAEAAQKAQVKEAQLVAWENGTGLPSIPQLRKLARVYKRPLAVFFLPAPPKDFAALRDFRRLPQSEVGKQSPALAFEIRRARSRREIAIDLYEELGGDEPRRFSARASLEENPETVAARLRSALGVRPAEVASWKTGHDAFNRWRSALEEAGVLVFQAEDVEVSEARGFSFSETTLPVIVVNMRDAVVGRIFSLLHEAAHLMLREAGLCDLLERGGQAEERIEPFCNRVAGAALMPQEALLAEPTVRGHKGLKWSDADIAQLAQRYRVSREALVRRLVVLGKTDEEFYRKKRKELLAEFEAQRQELEERKALGLEKPGFAPPHRTVLGAAGFLFTRLVLESYHQEKITASDLSSFLAIRLKHIPKIEQALQRRPEPPGAHA